MAAGDTEFTLRMRSNCEALETNEMMSTVNKVVMPLTKMAIHESVAGGTLLSWPWETNSVGNGMDLSG